jgi:hypothetical protein
MKDVPLQSQGQKGALALFISLALFGPFWDRTQGGTLSIAMGNGHQ